jgi:DNA-binding NtrC family response regulator
MRRTDRPRVLVVDDEPTLIQLITPALVRNGYEPVQARTGRDALEVFTDDIPLALIDLKLPDTNGLQLAENLRKLSSGTQIIIISGEGEIEDAVQAMKQGALDYIAKPFRLEDLMAQVHKAVSLGSTLREVSQLRQSLTSTPPIAGFLGVSSHVADLLRKVERLAPLDSTILITGESGTGKSLLARTIHHASPRANQPFVAVSCPSLPSELLESEMFGHEKGAFTGALQRRIGRIEMAEGGTLFLDEIGDLPLNLQPKLLTFLQDRNFLRLGGSKTVKADVRVIAATNVDLEERVQAREFRQDLYFRLNVIPLELPPLRARPDDVEFLATQYLVRLAKGKSPLKIAPDAVRMLRDYPWPGNVRELENVLERAAAFASSDTIHPEDLPATLKSSLFSPAGAVAPPSPGMPTSTPGTSSVELGQSSLEEIEKLAIIETLRKCDGNKAAAARILGIAEKSIYNKMQRLGMRTQPVA